MKSLLYVLLDVFTDRPFAGFLARAEGVGGARHWTIGQGVEMGRPSVTELYAQVRDGVADVVELGGHVRCPS